MSSVDVVVPCYNYGRYLAQCVESILLQKDVDVRVLIINDASSDDTAAIAHLLSMHDSRVSVHNHNVNRGNIATYNEGIEWASSDYMLILSADDYLLNGALDRAARLMDSHPAVGFTYGNAVRRDSITGEERSTASVKGKTGWHVISGLHFIKRCCGSNVVPSPTAVVRTAMQKRLGGYNPELVHSGDMEMWMRFAAHGDVGAISEHQAVYRRHATNMSLAYMADSKLADLQQAKAAVQCFFDSYGNKLAGSERLRKRAYRSVSRNALGCAREALDRNEVEVSRNLSDLAIDLCPGSRHSLAWARLWIKRLVTVRA